MTNKSTHSRKVVRYSESFKLEVVRQMEQEGLSVTEVSNRYGIKGTHTVNRWLKQYKKEALQAKKIWIMNTKEKDELLRMKQENEELRRLVVKLKLESLTYETLTEIACAEVGIDKETLKKKQAGQ